MTRMKLVAAGCVLLIVISIGMVILVACATPTDYVGAGAISTPMPPLTVPEDLTRYVDYEEGYVCYWLASDVLSLKCFPRLER